MLFEIKKVRQEEGEGPRRWFVNEEMDLILWYDLENSLEGFQLSYDKSAIQRSITWKRPSQSSGKSTLVSDGPLNKERVARLFKEASSNMEQELANFVLKCLNE